MPVPAAGAVHMGLGGGLDFDLGGRTVSVFVAAAGPMHVVVSVARPVRARCRRGTSLHANQRAVFGHQHIALEHLRAFGKRNRKRAT